MLTIKFYTTNGRLNNLKNTNKLISNINKKSFGRKYLEKKQHINGFAAIEKSLGKGFSDFHIHMLINDLGKNNRFNVFEFMDIVQKSSVNLLNNKGENVFPYTTPKVEYENTDGVSGLNAGCFHIIEKYSDDAVNYILKEVRDESSYADVKLLGQQGLSDYH
ncbi:MAG: hypothetical protein C0624_02755 [Desulfuromonas sp.]|nr:MAG: hypothetical protein C0624_02755 [Desulfuromonas sp.]